VSKKFDPTMKLRNACYAARGRCRNEKHPDYAKYGAKGIKFLFESLAEFTADVGLPENPNVSLDRINPHGHYEPGNVRWTSKAVQAVNKKALSHGSTPTLKQAMNKAAKAAENGELSLQATEAHQRWLSAIRRGGFINDDLNWAEGRTFRKRLFAWGWELGQHPDAAAPESFFRLPSLTMPGEVITLRGGPFYPCQADGGRGTLKPLLRPYDLNLPEQITEWIGDDRRGDKAGAVWVGQITIGMLDRGGPEGWMLAAASILRYRPEQPMFASMLPVRIALKRLAQLGHQSAWDNENDPLLDDKAVFIPDLQVDQGDGCNIATNDYFRLFALLQYRRKRGLKTFVGVQDHSKLPPALAQELLGGLFAVRDLGTLDLSDSPELPFATGPVNPGSRGLAAMAAVVHLKG
jgi:hypothetical protein